MKKSEFIKRIAFALMLVCVLALVSCGFKGCDKEEQIEVQVQNALDDVLNDAMPENEEPDELLVETESRSGYEVLSYTETETGVLVTFLVHAPDLYTVVKEIDENYEFETEEELKAALIEAVSQAQIIEQEITVEFALVDGEYVPMLSFEFFDAYYGGIFKLLNESLGDMDEEVAQ